VLMASTAPAFADGLVEGGFGLDGSADPSVGLQIETPSFGDRGDNLSAIDFTPRRHAPALAGDWRERLEMRVDIDPHFGERFGFASDNAAAPSAAMLVGGALKLDDVAVKGGIGRTTIFGGTADVLSAGMALGDMSASLSFGQTQDKVEGERDVMMLSTDLAIAPWITLQGDVALTESVDEREPLAIGRVGVKLRF